MVVSVRSSIEASAIAARLLVTIWALIAGSCYASGQEFMTPAGADLPSETEPGDVKPAVPRASTAEPRSPAGPSEASESGEKTGANSTARTASTAVAASPHYAAGMLELKLRDYQKAIEAFSKAIAAAPDFAAAYAERGHARIGAGNHEQAVADLNKALELFGNKVQPAERARLTGNRGLAYLSLGRHTQAMADFDRAIELDPKLAFAYANRGLSQMQLKQFEPALRDVGMAIGLKPAYDFAYLLRGLIQMERKRYTEAAVDFQRVLVTSPDNRGAILGLRQALMAGRETEEAARIRLVRSADSGCEPACGEWIAIDGKIEAGAAETLKDLLKSIKRRVPIFVDSGGGSVTDAMEMGRVIRASALDVVVSRTVAVPCARDDAVCRKRTATGRVLGRPVAAGAICASSCGFLLAAGTHRYVGGSTLVGVHQITSFQTFQKVYRQYEVRRAVRDGKIVEVDRRVVSETRGAKRTVQTATKDETYVRIRKYFSEMGISEAIMPLLIGAPAKGMHWLTAAELRATALMTDVGQGEQLVARGVVPRVGLDGAAPVAAMPSDAAKRVTTAAAAPSDLAALTRAIQVQLARIGCAPRVEDGKWSAGVRRAVERVNILTGQSLSTSAPVPETLTALTARTGLTCPQVCPADMMESGAQCVAKPSAASRPGSGTAN